MVRRALRLARSAHGQLVLAFIVTTLVMAVVYDGFWQVRPDYFRVQPGLNVLPLEVGSIARSYSAYSRSRPLPAYFDDVQDDKALQDVEATNSKFQNATVILDSDKAQLASREAAIASEYKAFESSQWRQYEAFVSDQTAPFKEREETARLKRDRLLGAAGVKSSGQPGPSQAAIYAGANLVFLERSAERLRKEAEAREYGLHHLENFQGKLDQQSYLAHERATEGLRRKVLAEQEGSDHLYAQLDDALLQYRRAISSRLNYIDFVYFSVGAATTATFGDIAPNASLVRGLICAQVLLSIVLFGLFINKLAADSLGGKGPASTE